METLQVNRKKIEKLSTVLNNSRIKIFEYLVDEDTLVVYNNKFHIEKTIAGYMDYIDNKSKIHPEDREKIKQIYKEAKEATVEIREFGEDGDIKHSVLEFTKIVNEDGKLTLIGSTRDITEQRKQEKKLKERARKDSLTGLYNQVYGKKCINKYLNRKKPFDSCGMIVLDVDCFKLVNDNIAAVPRAIAIARRTKRVMLQAVIAGLVLATIGMIAAAFNLIPVVVGAFLQEAIDVVSILWALTALIDRD